MSDNLKQYPLNNKYGEESGTKIIPSLDSWKQGIGFKSDVKSTTLTGDIYQLSEAVQYLQFTGGLYDKKAEYHEGNIVSLVYKNDRDVYEIQMFRRAGSNIGATTNNAPYNDAQVETVNGVDTYSGGTRNSDWVMCSTSGSIEPIAGTLVQRDSEGASKINMPSVVDDKSIVNKEYLKAKNIFFDKSGSVPASDVQEAINSVHQTNVLQESQISTNKSNITNLQSGLEEANGLIGNNTRDLQMLARQIGELQTKQAIPLYYIQFPNYDIGVLPFSSYEEPANYYQNNFGITTTWKLQFHQAYGYFFRTEGRYSSVDRLNGTQEDSGKEAVGGFSADTGAGLTRGNVYNGVFYAGFLYDYGAQTEKRPANKTIYNLSRAYTVSDEFRPYNLLMRVWKLKTINGQPIRDEGALSDMPSSYYQNLNTNQVYNLNFTSASSLFDIDVSCDWELLDNYPKDVVFELMKYKTNNVSVITYNKSGHSWFEIKLIASGFKPLVKRINYELIVENFNKIGD